MHVSMIARTWPMAMRVAYARGLHADLVRMAAMKSLGLGPRLSRGLSAARARDA